MEKNIYRHLYIPSLPAQELFDTITDQRFEICNRGRSFKYSPAMTSFEGCNGITYRRHEREQNMVSITTLLVSIELTYWICNNTYLFIRSSVCEINFSSHNPMFYVVIAGMYLLWFP